MQIDLSIIAQHYVAVFVLLIALLSVKIVVVFGIVYFQAGSRVALKSALALCQSGEFSLAIIALASSSKLIPQDNVQVLIIVVVLSMVATPFILKISS